MWKYIKRYNESIIDYDSDNIKSFYTEAKSALDKSDVLTLIEVKSIAKKHDIEVVNYKTFYDDLPDKDKHTAPPSYVTFALVNPVTHKARIVLNSKLDLERLESIYHMLKHENIHIKQIKKRPGFEQPMINPTNQKAYFSDSDEVMAFAQSISDLIMNSDPKNLNDAIKKINNNHLFLAAKRNVDQKVLNKYKKYIYLYLEKEFEKKKKNDTTI